MAFESAWAVNTAGLAEVAVSALKVAGVEIAASESWKVERELFRVPSAEIRVVTAWVCLDMVAS